MRGPRVTWLLAALALTLNACVTPSDQMKVWMGRPESELVAKWGQPQSIVSDGQGGRILVYEGTHSYTASETNITHYGETTTTTTHIPAKTTEYGSIRKFWVNEKGVVYRWWWKGI